MEEKVKKEVADEHQKKLEAGFEKEWLENKKAEVKEGVQREYEAMLARMRSKISFPLHTVC